MGRLIVFNSISLDGYFTDANNDMSWAHKNDPEWNDFTAENAQGGGTLLLGRVTYDLLKSFWTTEKARQMMPEVAEGMNKIQKVVFSRTMENSDWNNTKVLKGNLIEEVKKMRGESGNSMVILGSGSIVSQLSEHRLIDEYQCVIVPIVLGKGRTMFEGMSEKLNLNRRDVRAFKNGNVVLSYQPVS